MNTVRQRYEKQRTDESHPAWKGDEASYFSKHRWLYARLGRPKECLHCGVTAQQKVLQWASLSGKCKRDTRDFIGLCVPCHKKFDRIMAYGNMCSKGHEMTGENTGRSGKYRVCKKCHNEQAERYREGHPWNPILKRRVKASFL